MMQNGRIKDLFLFMLRYTTSNNTIYSFFIKMWFIPKVTLKKYTSVMIRVCHSRSLFCHACTSMTNL